MRIFRVAAPLAALALLTASPVAASEGRPAVAGAELGVVLERFAYEEPDLMEESGPQAGLYGAWTGFFGPGLMVHGFASFAGGDLDYEGGLQGEDAQGRRFIIPSTASTPNSVLNLRLASGWLIGLGGLDVVPYAGIGYRMLSNEIGDVMDLEGYGPTRVNCAGYQRDQSYTYVPLGVRVATAFAGGWSAEAVAEYDLFLAGENHSHRTECGMDLTFQQDSGSGYRASVSVVSPPLLGAWRATIEPYLEHWEIGESERLIRGDSYWVEPENTATSVGVRLGLRY